MKVVHVLYSGLGGHGSVFFSMVNADESHNFSYGAIFNGVEPVRAEYKERCEALKIPFAFVPKSPGAHIDFNYRLLKAIREAKPDIIFLHGSMAVLAAYGASVLMKRKPLIVVRETQALHMKTFAEKTSLKVAMLLADKIVFLSEAYQKEVRQHLGALYKDKKVSVIPNGIDLSFFKPATKNIGSVWQLGMQSRIVSIKDHVSLIRALAILKADPKNPVFRLSIAGDGAYREKLEVLVVELGLQENVVFIGMLDESGLPEFLQSLDIYIHASLGETMSTAIMQAMACGLPVIASDVDGINNMVSNLCTGLLVPAKDAEALAKTILELCRDKSLRETLASNALKYAEDRFSNKRMFNSYRGLFK